MLTRHGRMAGGVAGAIAASLLLAGTLLTRVASAEPEAPAAAAAPAPTGVWQAHRYNFNYMGFTSIYTCDGLADKLRLLLRLTGAGPEFKVSERCATGFNRPDRLAMADLTFSTLQPDAPNPVAVGTWQHVELSPNHPFDLGRGDCELIEEFRDRVLPMFAVRNIENNVTCVPYQDTGADFRLSFDVFAPLKPVKGRKNRIS